MRSCAVALMSVFGALAACQPVEQDGYSSSYRPSQLDRVPASNLLAATPEEIARGARQGPGGLRGRAAAADDAVRQPVGAAERAARRAAPAPGADARPRAARPRLGEPRRRPGRSASCARPSGWTGAPSAATVRPRGRAEAPRADRGPARPRPAAAGGPGRRTRRGPARPDGRSRLRPPSGCASWTASTGARPSGNSPRRQEAPDPLVQRYLPYRRQGESVEALRARVETARAQSAATGEPVASLLREGAE